MLKFFAALFAVLVLSAIFVPSACGCSVKERSATAVVKADLRNLNAAQEGFFADSGHYADSFVELDSIRFRESRGSSIAIESAADSGFLAAGTHINMPELRCSLASGRFATDSLPDGEPVCTPTHKGTWLRTLFAR